MAETGWTTSAPTVCIECKPDKSTWNPVNGFCEFDPEPENDEVDYCGCKCIFGFESERERAAATDTDNIRQMKEQKIK